MELMDKLSRYTLESAKTIGGCLANGSVRYEDLLSAYQSRAVRFADGDSDEEDISDESAEAKAAYFWRHCYFYVQRDKPDVGGKWQKVHMPIVGVQHGTSGQLLVDWIPVYRTNWQDGRSTQPSFNPPAGCEVHADGLLTREGRGGTELRCTRFATSADGAEFEKDLEAERLRYLESLGRRIKNFPSFPTENRVDLADPLDLDKCRAWLAQIARSFYEEFFVEGTAGQVPPTKLQVSQMMEGAFALVMQRRVLPSSEAGRSKPSKCGHCSESLFGNDELGTCTVPQDQR